MIKRSSYAQPIPNRSKRYRQLHVGFAYDTLKKESPLT